MSIIEKRFRSTKKALEYLESLAGNDNDYIFRGHTKKEYRLSTTLQRFSNRPHESWDSRIDEMIEMFRIGLVKLDLTPFQGNNRQDWLEYSRHHGLPTPYIDFSYSPYVALFFAFNGVRIDYLAKKPRYSVVYALNIKQLASAWASKVSKNYDSKIDGKKYTVEYDKFLYPKSLFKKGFPGDRLQFIPSPSKYNKRMQKQMGCLIYDTLDHKMNSLKDLESFINNYKELDVHSSESKVEKGKVTLYKVFINQRDTSYIFEKLELMDMTAGNLLMNPDAVSMDVINSYFYHSRVSYLRDIQSNPIDDENM